jgi:hypothetical protein
MFLLEKRHIRISLLVTCISVIFLELSEGLNAGLIFGMGKELGARLIFWLGTGLIFGLGYWFVLGLMQGMTQERLEDQDRRVANEGIRRSLRNGVMMSIIGGAVLGSIGILSKGLSAGFLIGPNGALLIGILTGGLAVWRHSIIRLLLFHSRTFPGRAPQFLNDSAARFLLRRVGGGYSFAHRLLLDHLANTGTAPKASVLPFSTDE